MQQVLSRCNVTLRKRASIIRPLEAETRLFLQEAAKRIESLPHSAEIATMAEINGNYCTFLFPEVDLIAAAGSSPTLIRRGPMYSAYAELRESKLRRKRTQFMTTPHSAPTRKSPAASSPLCRSVPDFSMALRKENRKPAGLPPTPTHLGRQFGPPATPPPAVARNAAQKRAGSASASSPEVKRYGGGGGCGDARKSYSCLKELKQFSAMAAASLDEEDRGEKRRSKGSFESYRRRTATWMDY